MNITRENVDALNSIIRMNIEKSDYEGKVENSLKEYRKKASMPGFRPGKIPQGLIVKMYGKSVMAEEVNKLISENLSKFIMDEKLNILGEPLPNETLQKEIDWDKDVDFEFIFDLGLAPEVSLAFDKRNKFPYFMVSISEEMIDKQVEAYANRFGASKPADLVDADATVRGKLIQLDEAGNEAEAGISVESALLAVNIIKDEDSKTLFINKKVGEEVVFDLRKAYPNDTEIAYLLNIPKEEAENINGNFKLTINEINTFVLAEVNQELFDKVFGEEAGIKDEPAFRSEVAAQIKESFQSSSEYKFSIDAREILISKLNPELPEAFLKRWLLAANKDLTAEQIESEFDYFVEDLRWQLIKEQFVKDNDLKVLEEEIVAFAKDIAAAQFRQYGMFSVPEEHLDGFAKQMLDKKEDRNRIYTRVQEQKMMSILKDKVTLDEKVVSKEDFEKLFENA